MADRGAGAVDELKSEREEGERERESDLKGLSGINKGNPRDSRTDDNRITIGEVGTGYGCESE